MNIKTFAINLEKRPNRKEHILEQFALKDEFDLTIVKAQEHTNGATGLWNTIKDIVEHQITDEEEFILLCEDDHEFTPNYSKELLFDCIRQACVRDADLLSGGASNVKSTIQECSNLFWMEQFTGLQFTIIFKRFFRSIVQYNFLSGDDADIVFSKIADNKFLIFPFISIQKEFGYSDITPRNAQTGYVAKLFDKSSEKVKAFIGIERFYNQFNREHLVDSYEHICIPTYVICSEDNAETLKGIRRQFEGKEEFDLHICPTSGEKLNALPVTHKIVDIVQTSIIDDDDIIIICTCAHQFTEHYNKKSFLNNIVEAHSQGVNLLLGGLSDFDSAIFVSSNRFWITNFENANFIVVYRKMFESILSAFADVPLVTPNMLSDLTSHKLVTYPPISFGIDELQQVQGLQNTYHDIPHFMSERLNRILKVHKRIKPDNQ